MGPGTQIGLAGSGARMPLMQFFKDLSLSAFTAGFVSGAHTADDIAATVAATREVFKKLSK